MAGKGILGNILGVLFGAVTPFCACSTVPITLGLLKAGVPFGTVISFVISSPLMDPLVFKMLAAFMGWKVAVAFLLLTSAAVVIFGVILDKIGWSNQVKNVRIKGGGHEQNDDRVFSRNELVSVVYNRNYTDGKFSSVEEGLRYISEKGFF